MLSIGNKRIPVPLIKSVDQETNSIIVSFYLGHKLRIVFKTIKEADNEYTRVMEKLGSKKMMKQRRFLF